MIYYFSGTGNSRYAARRLSPLAGEAACFIPAADVRSQGLGDSKSVGFVFPVYAWGVPPLVMDFIRRLPEGFAKEVKEKGIPVWCVAVCGDETGMAVGMLRKGLADKGLVLKGAWSLIMPNVYVMLPGFGVDPKDVEERKLKDSIGRLAEIGRKVSEGEWEEDVHLGPWPRLKTRAVYPLFKRWGVNPKKWHATDGCIGCGKCAASCPVGNIDMKDGRPVWGDRCVSCCACYHCCPTHSANYGSITEKQGQYQGFRF